jgi:myo-inositol catabolism protein IolC
VTIGYNKPLYILPYDHRSSFEKGLYGWSGALSAEQTDRIAKTKEVIYDAFRLALTKALAREGAGILVDEQFGAAILRDAVRNGYITAMPAEKSGQAEFQFEYGDQWAAHIDAFKPTFVKVLVRYNPEDDDALNRRQAARLKLLSDYCHSHAFTSCSNCWFRRLMSRPTASTATTSIRYRPPSIAHDGQHQGIARSGCRT